MDVIDLNEIDKLKKWFKRGFRAGNAYWHFMSQEKADRVSENEFVAIIANLRKIKEDE